MSNLTKGQILLVDDDEMMREACAQWLTLADYQVEQCCDAEQALAYIDPACPRILVTDIKMPRIDGLQLMQRVLEIDPAYPVILMTGHGDIAMAVEAMRNGALDFIEKPFAPERLIEVVEKAVDQRSRTLQRRRFDDQLSQASGIEALLLGDSEPMLELREWVEDLAQTQVSVLINGETGSGKEQVALALHQCGPRAAAEFVAINCAAIPENMFESEIFGHEAGAFTGALGKRTGKMAFADGGTLFLDEIESMPLPLQAKLLRAIQSQAVEPLGSNQPQAVDLRLVAASKVDLRTESEAGRFREDLFYRLNVAEVNIPPLRERREDIPLLFEHFCQLAADKLELPECEPDSDDIHCLMLHRWPGNIRELKNIAERFILGNVRKRRSVQEIMAQSERFAQRSFPEYVESFERSLIEQALVRHQGDVKAVLEALNLPRRTLNEKMRRYGLVSKSYR
ncbi:sigma-54-dependent transcriptional regulator [Marinobacterium arenosum]|uniref:sigma-54-dependent transcriptional regulator n=1 Tax=Marinobacterium arenosum TaxID=2862496 RepID=UPI001C96FB27|nr:sigma-54 dependent transcriptional regulator [Marinobacterium arenosum]MBY4677305.1 sigma-54 dependent transcriptional regulator [Marinobacterium arenosum]